jgi:ribose-phosphate pyrophosphokinase
MTAATGKSDFLMGQARENGQLAVFAGGARPELAREICAELGVELLPTEVRRFSNDCLQVQLQANCRRRDVYIVQPLVPPVQEHLSE